MNATQEVKKARAYRDSFQTFIPSGNDAYWLQEFRASAYRRFQTLNFPARKAEAWKYTNLETILNTSFTPVDRDSFAVRPQDLEPYFFPEENKNRMVLINGNYSQRLSAEQDLPPGVFLKDMASVVKFEPERIKKYLEQGIFKEQNVFAAINAFDFRDGAFLHVPENCTVNLPIHLLFAGVGRSASPWTFSPRVLIVMDAGATANVILDHAEINGERYFMNGVLEAHLAKNAKLNCVSVFRNSHQSFQFMTTHARLAEESRFEMISCMLGEGMNRQEVIADFEGEHAVCNLQGLSLLSGSAQVFHHLTANHRRSHGQSQQLYKMILADESLSEFNSLVHVFPDAQKSDSNQQNRNLLLSEAARAYSRPQLKIEADDVRCVHGSATGPLESEELFYLQSRGLNPETARQVITYGFIKEVLEKIRPDSLRKQLEESFRRGLDTLIQKGKGSC